MPGKEGTKEASEGKGVFCSGLDKGDMSYLLWTGQVASHRAPEPKSLGSLWKAFSFFRLILSTVQGEDGSQAHQEVKTFRVSAPRG